MKRETRIAVSLLPLHGIRDRNTGNAGVCRETDGATKMLTELRCCSDVTMNIWRCPRSGFYARTSTVNVRQDEHTETTVNAMCKQLMNSMILHGRQSHQWTSGARKSTYKK